MPATPADQRIGEWETEVRELRALIRDLTARIEELEALSDSSATAVSAASVGVSNSALPRGSDRAPADPSTLTDSAARNRVLRGIGVWLREALRDRRLGLSGRELLPGYSRRYLILRTYSGEDCNPARVEAPWAEAERVVSRRGDLGPSVFVGLPRWADLAVVAEAAGVQLPLGN